MASYLRPRRGKKATAESQNIVLKRGEVFFESPTGGVGTGTGRIKIGDGTTAYTSLPYFINPDNNTDSFYGTCSTAAATAKKVVTLSDTAGWELKAGTIVGVKFTNTNTASSCTLNVNGTGDKSIWYNTSVYTGNSTQICGAANIIIFYMYDGTNWVWINMSKMNGNTDIRPSAYCDTAAGTAAKVASCTGYSLLDKSWLHVTIVNANTSATALTLNVNGKGAKSIYINGTASSTTNHTLPAGTYLVYYASNIYYFRTDGKLTANITGTATPVSHASTGTGYGQGNASNYGHVKLSDTYGSAVSGGNAAGGIGASQNALYNVYSSIKQVREISGTLAANATSIELTYTESNPAVFNSSFTDMVVDIYTDKVSLQYINISQTVVASKSIKFTITFPAQTTSTSILLRLTKKS